MSKNLGKILTSIISIVIMLSLTTSVAFAGTLDVIKGDFYSMVLNREKSMNISYDQGVELMNDEDITGMPKFVNYACGDDLYAAASCASIGTVSDGSSVSKIVALYLTTKEQENSITQKSKEIIAKIIKPGATDLQKTQLLYDYICTNVKLVTPGRGYSAYNGLVEGQTSAKGFALTFYRLFSEAGIPTKIVYSGSRETLGYWNLAQVNGKWYHFDTLRAISSSRAKFYGVSDTTITSYGLPFNKRNLPDATSNLVYIPTSSTTPIALATAAVVQCEKVRTVESVNASAKIVNSLLVGAERTVLLARLQKVQVAIRSSVTAPTNPALDTATASVVQCEKIRTMESVNASAKIVNTLPSGAARTALLARVQKVQVAIRAASR